MPRSPPDADGHDEGKRRNKWSAQEDEVILAHVNQYGAKDWGKLAETLQATLGGNRTAKSCRLRWYNELTPTINRAPFSETEMAFIMRAVLEYGTTWSRISQAMAGAGMPGRTDNAIKNCYHVRLKRAMQEQGLEAGAGLKSTTSLPPIAPTQGNSNRSGQASSSATRNHESPPQSTLDNALNLGALSGSGPLPTGFMNMPYPADMLSPTADIHGLPHLPIGPGLQTAWSELPPSHAIAMEVSGQTAPNSPKRHAQQSKHRRVYKRGSRMKASQHNESDTEDSEIEDSGYQRRRRNTHESDMQVDPVGTPPRTHRVKVKHHLNDRLALRSTSSAPNMADNTNNSSSTGGAPMPGSSGGGAAAALAVWEWQQANQGVSPPPWSQSPVTSSAGYATGSPLSGNLNPLSLSGGGGAQPPRHMQPGQLGVPGASPFHAMAGGFGSKSAGPSSLGPKSSLQAATPCSWQKQAPENLPAGVSSSWDASVPRLDAIKTAHSIDRPGLNMISVPPANNISHQESPRNALAVRFADMSFPNGSISAGGGMSPLCDDAAKRRSSTSARYYNPPELNLMPMGIDLSSNVHSSYHAGGGVNKAGFEAPTSISSDFTGNLAMKAFGSTMDIPQSGWHQPGGGMDALYQPPVKSPAAPLPMREPLISTQPDWSGLRMPGGMSHALAQPQRAWPGSSSSETQALILPPMSTSDAATGADLNWPGAGMPSMDGTTTGRVSQDILNVLMLNGSRSTSLEQQPPGVQGTAWGPRVSNVSMTKLGPQASGDELFDAQLEELQEYLTTNCH